MSERQASDKSYQHYYNEVREDPKWPDEYNFRLIESIDELLSVLGKANKWFALDTETKGLLHEPGSIVGFSFTLDTDLTTGYYVAIGHENGRERNLDPKEALGVLVGHMKRVKFVAYFNYTFDARQIRAQGFGIEPLNGWSYMDTQCAVHLLDSNTGMPSLKASARRFLGWDMEAFESVLGEKDNIAKVSPEDVAGYAGADALATAHLVRRVVPRVRKECDFIFKLDNRLLYPMMIMSEQLMNLDWKKLSRIERKAMSRAKTLEGLIYAKVGTKFNIASADQVRKAMIDLGIDTGVYSQKTGRMSCGKDELAKVDHPVAKHITEYRQQLGVESKFTRPLVEAGKRSAGRFSYKTCQTATGRFAGGSGDKNKYFTKVNIQGVTKPKSRMFFVCDPEEADTMVLGYGLKAAPKKIEEALAEAKKRGYTQWVEGQEPEMNLRSCFDVPKGHVFLSLDYAGEETRLAANMSGERKWINAYLKGEDIHTLTSLMIFGMEDSDTRKKAKAINFGIIYGASKYGIAWQLNIPRDAEDLMRRGLPMDTPTAEQFVNKFQKGVPTLFNYINTQRSIARRNGWVTTHWGRPRRLRYYYAHPDWKKKSYADRCVFNTKIQGTAGDFIRKVIIEIFYQVLMKETTDLLFRSTVHDEVNWSVLEERVHELGGKILNIMRMKLPGWPVPLEVGISIGDSWGNLFPFRHDDQTGLFELDGKPVK